MNSWLHAVIFYKGFRMKSYLSILRIMFVENSRLIFKGTQNFCGVYFLIKQWIKKIIRDRNFLHYKWIIMILGLIGNTVHAAYIQADELDWDSVQGDSEFTFIPLKRQNQGVLLYEDYDRALIGPTYSFSPYEKTVRIRILPKFYNTNAYHRFLKERNIIDIRRNLDFTNLLSPIQHNVKSICKPTAGLQAFIKTMTFIPKLRIDPGNYPGLCSLEIKYLVPDDSPDEGNLLTYISMHKIIEVDFHLPRLPSRNRHKRL